MHHAGWLVPATTVVAILASPAGLAAQHTPTVTVGGVGYAHFRYQLDADSSLPGGAHRNNFDVERSYITVAGRLRDGITTRITADVDRRRAASNQLTFRLKYGYVAWTPDSSALTWKLGMIQTPVIEFLEALWGYRMQGQVALDRNGYLPSSDFGASVDGTWDDGRIQATAGIYNGEGYSNAPGDAGKDLALRASVRLAATDTTSRTAGLRLTGYGHYGKATGGGTRSRWMGLLSYQTRRLTLGAEYTVTRDSTAPDAPDTRGTVFSAYGVYQLPASPLAVLARVDRVDPDADRSPSVPDLATGVQTRVIAGASWRLTPEVRLLLDADLLSLQHGSPNNAFHAGRRTIYFHTEVRF